MSSIKAYMNGTSAAKKKDQPSSNGTSAHSGIPTIPGRKRIRRPVSDSSDDDDRHHTHKKTTTVTSSGSSAQISPKPKTSNGSPSAQISPPAKPKTSNGSSSAHLASPSKPKTSNGSASSSHSPHKHHHHGSSSSGLSVGEKEQLIGKLIEQRSDCDTAHAHEALSRNGWRLEAALKYLRDRSPRKKSSSSHHSSSTSTSSHSHKSPHKHHHHHSSSSNGHHHQHHRGHSKTSPTATSSSSHSLAVPAKSASGPKRRHSGSADEHSDNGDAGYRKSKKAVFESDDDDSDDDRPKASVYQMNAERQKVFDFLNGQKPNEFLCVRGMSQKKVEALAAMRPFHDWGDLVRRVRDHKGISCDVLNMCQEYLTRRNNLTRIMSKCTSMVDRLEKAVADGGGIAQQPALLNADLRLADYQLIGLNWFAVMHQEDMNGILADEMGLGKTIQVISFLAWLKETGQSRGPHLVVVPSSTIENWANEMAKWCPALHLVKYYGSIDDRRHLRKTFSTGGLDDVDVLLTTYHTVGSTPEERKMFRVLKIHYVVFDEAHMLKNMTTQRYANLIRINAQRRLLLTGTPLQNNLLELMSLLCFVMPSLFASNTDDIKALFQKNSKIQTDDDELSSFEHSQIEQAKRIMKPFVLRRIKDVVLNSLPPKTDHTLMVPMADAQAGHYRDLVQTHKRAGEVSPAQDGEEVAGMTIMMEMRKLANHPLLMRHYYTDEMLHEIAVRLSTHPFYKKNRHPPYIFEELAVLSDFQVQQTLEKFDVKSMNIPDRLIVGSGKFEKLDELLPRLKRDGHRVLIFSQFTMMLDILERYLDVREHGFLRLDGSTAVTDRQQLIDQYMTDEDMFIFLLSTRAGGLGINLTAADTVIIHDIDFNPYNDKQAEDRCHRMGQKRPVTIYRMVSEGTIEEGMRVMAQQKLDLEKEVTTNGGRTGEKEKEQKCMIRILTMALGISDDKSEQLLSPPPAKKSTSGGSGAGAAKATKSRRDADENGDSG